MFLAAGIAMAVLGLSAFVYSLPRGGKVAAFVGSQWEGYVVVLIIGFFAVGLILSLLGTIELMK